MRMRVMARRDPAAPSRVARFRDGVEVVPELLGSGEVRAREAPGVGVGVGATP